MSPPETPDLAAPAARYHEDVWCLDELLDEPSAARLAAEIERFEQPLEVGARSCAWD